MDYCSVWFMGMFGFPAKRPRDPDGSVDLEDDAIRDKKVWGMNGLAASGWSALLVSAANIESRDPVPYPCGRPRMSLSMSTTFSRSILLL